jgi:hypothetical protein
MLEHYKLKILSSVAIFTKYFRTREQLNVTNIVKEIEDYKKNGLNMLNARQ